jgi:hypothetical protein
MATQELSLCTTTILLKKGNEQVSQGTGFFFLLKSEKGNTIYLITNVHVLTGHSPGIDKPPIGDKITFQIRRSLENTQDVKIVTRDLYTTKGQPCWWVSKTTPEADLAVMALPAHLISDTRQMCIDSSLDTTSLSIQPSSPINLIGYPYGYHDTHNNLPIWKTGSIASEPELNFNGLPLIVVDVSAYPGMSGAPVFSVAHGSYVSKNGDTVIGSATRFLGVYASMQMFNERKYLEEYANSENKYGITSSQSLQLGHVWKSSIIKEIISSIDVDQWMDQVGQYMTDVVTQNIAKPIHSSYAPRWTPMT